MGNFLYQDLDSVSKMGFLNNEIPDYIAKNLNPKFELRPYQVEAFSHFFHCFKKDFSNKKIPLHLLFNMATGSGKTLIMAGLILYLFKQGYNKFLFFVNSTNIIKKTKDNFLNFTSSKFLFQENIIFDDQRINVSPVDNFEGTNSNEINICFTTIQKLHSNLSTEKENSITFEDFRKEKIVILADEAHHINTRTKSRNQKDFISWEDTVEGIFKQNKSNLLLEFTATMDYSHNDIREKYLNKAIFLYDLKSFRNDGYSKDVYIVRSDFKQKDRIIQALILNQYKREVATKYQINLKPVILFKAHKYIKQSQENKVDFHKLIDDLSASDVEKIRNKSNIDIVRQAFDFFDKDKITSRQLTERIRKEFSKNHCISVNDEKEKESNQLLINSLEDKDNPVRAVFAVNKLNEGWDVLNLFDIVRCYESRVVNQGKPGKITISEAQLIGRGARYFPFTGSDNDDRFKRKFDQDIQNELRILEELHYHSINDSRYISEIKQALIEQGMLDEKEVKRELKLKDSFKTASLYKEGIIFINDKIHKDYKNIESLADLGVTNPKHIYKIPTGQGFKESLFNESATDNNHSKKNRNVEVVIQNIPFHIVENAVARKKFYAFRNLNRYFPHLKSIHEFITSENYLGKLKIIFNGIEEEVKNLRNKSQFDALLELLDKTEIEINKNITQFKGTPEFKPHRISAVFQDKILKFHEESERTEGDKEFVEDKKWYVFNANYGTSEEKKFVRMLDEEMEKISQKYADICLIRNERHFKIYNFKDGKAFEPDFVLFLQKKNGHILSCQIFIEPKGKYLEKHDGWKEEFLKEIKAKAKPGRHIYDKSEYKIIGLPFYNSEDEDSFKESLFEVV